MMIRLLDHGFVRLVSFTQPVPYESYQVDRTDEKEDISYLGKRSIRPDNWTGDLEIIRNARVSHDADWRNDGTVLHEAHCLSILPPMSTGEARTCNCTPRTVSDSRLMDHLYKNFHSTPFEAIEFTFEVQAPIFVFRQWHRHRTWTYNEVSARYTELPSTYYVPNPEDIGTQNPGNKQGRIMTAAQDYGERERQRLMVEGYDIEARLAHKTYQDRLAENEIGTSPGNWHGSISPCQRIPECSAKFPYGICSAFSTCGIIPMRSTRSACTLPLSSR